ncbi:DUF2933 domain-containing protein [Oceanirhabdus sp. W0125-5]|uniref:DUF2933 domain-containing protein n=1 Tax=Oceanirhabdus sp. W0125-5 TaxID=2999116 RepID=UPI0022F2B738|nr:DUF2933 domain-containing protein [Oceanirhabdus sp. W0125-5]WBW95019.1 DUF2933 domain-containing protein [Oceanirhabdus sp. W0125-5]
MKFREKSNIFKFGFMMMLCCLLPIILVGALPLLGIKSASLAFLPFLICPLMHIGMIFMIGKGVKGKSCCSKRDNKEIEMENEQ